MKQVYLLNHAPLNVYFAKNSDNFVVHEIPLYEFSGEGEHLVLHVRKKEMTTWEMLKVLSEISGAKVRDFGYAGLKDKDGLTTQHISIHKKFQSIFEKFSHEKIKILDQTYHNNKLKIGHLKGNRFFIRLKKVLPIDAKKLEDGLELMGKEGFANYFGYQRFGKEKNNANEGFEILSGIRKMRDKKMKKFLISAYQSHLFNSWLNKRVEISKLVNNFSIKEMKDIFPWSEELLHSLKSQKQFLKIFLGDVMHHYPHGRAYICEDLKAEVERFCSCEVAPTGWLVGSRSMQSMHDAKSVEDSFFKDALPYIEQMSGARRFAWSFLEDVQYTYKENEAWFEMSFILQKGSYATVILDELLKNPKE